MGQLIPQYYAKLGKTLAHHINKNILLDRTMKLAEFNSYLSRIGDYEAGSQ